MVRVPFDYALLLEPRGDFASGGEKLLPCDRDRGSGEDGYSGKPLIALLLLSFEA